MPQISPMNWMLIFFFFIYTIMFFMKMIMYEKLVFVMKKKLNK